MTTKALIHKMDEDLQLLKEINDSRVDVIRTNEIIQIEKELMDLKETLEIMEKIIVSDGHKLDKIEHNIINSTQCIKKTNRIIMEYDKPKLNLIKIIGGATLGGIVLGGIGSIFGTIPTIIGIGIGTCIGGITIKNT